MAETGGELVHEKLAARSTYRLLKKKLCFDHFGEQFKINEVLCWLGVRNTFFPTKFLKNLKKSLLAFPCTCFAYYELINSNFQHPHLSSPHSPSQGKPRAFELLKIVSLKFLPPPAKIVFKCRTLSSDLSVKCPSQRTVVVGSCRL